jgi:hypothetical protein
MIKIDVRKQDIEGLKDLKKQLSKPQVASATRMALNDSIRKGKTETKKAITAIYNIKPSRIDDSSKKKGLSLKLATNSSLSAEVDAGHVPVNLSETKVSYKGVVVAMQVKYKNGQAKKGKSFKRSTSAISVQVRKDEGAKVINTAFTIGSATHAKTGNQFATSAIFARGKKGKPVFSFGKSRYPIDSLSTVSVATAALNVKAKEKVQPVVSAFYKKDIQKQMQRLIDKSK